MGWQTEGMKPLAATLTLLILTSMAAPSAMGAQQPQSARSETARTKLVSAAPGLESMARKAGFFGWPEQLKDGSLIPGASWEARLFDNDRVLLFRDESSGVLSALVLLPMGPDGASGIYRLAWVRDLLANPRIELASLWGNKPDDYPPGYVLLWEGELRDSRLHRSGWFEFGIGPSDSDNITRLLGGTGAVCPLMIDELTDGKGELEGAHPTMDEDFAQTMTRLDFQSAVKKGEANGFVWFEVKGKPYAAKKGDWLTWLKGPRPPVTKETN